MISKSYERSLGFVVANLGEEIALLDMPSGSYLGFNATAAHVWRLLDRPLTLDAVCGAMIKEFDIDEERCRREVSLLLDNLVAAGLVRADERDVA